MAITLTKDNFEAEVLKEDGLVLVDYWASWCNPCRMIAPIIDNLSEEYKGRVKVGKINVDEERKFASDSAIVSIPTLILMKNGKEIERMVGVNSKDDIEEMLEKYL